MSNFKSDILIVGVGGQGTLLASRILGAIAALNEEDCKLSEVHGMSQRGGSVVTHVRIDKEVISPVITIGEADYIMAFESLEAARWKHYLKKGGTIIVNKQEILPMPVITGKEEYPQNIIETIIDEGIKVYQLSALDMAIKAGNSKAVNVVLIGAYCALNNINIDTAIKALEISVKKNFFEINKNALKLGYDAIKKQKKL